MIKSKYLLFIVIAIIFAFITKGIINYLPKTLNTNSQNVSFVTIGNNVIEVDIAKTNLEKARGLSGKESLSPDKGMLFVFNQKIMPSFWMKDMNFPIDIIWIEDDTIIHIDKNAPPPKPNQNVVSLQIFRPPKAINYVLEVNAGFSEKHNIEVGNIVSFTNL